MISLKNNEMFHHGVKGMHWGVRKRNVSNWQLSYGRKLNSKDKKIDKAISKEAKKDALTYHAIKKHNVSLFKQQKLASSIKNKAYKNKDYAKEFSKFYNERQESSKRLQQGIKSSKKIFNKFKNKTIKDIERIKK